MKGFKNILKSQLPHLTYFYGYLGNKVFTIILLNIIVGVLDGLGLSMFFPLLEMGDGSSLDNTRHLGHLRFMVDALQPLGLVLNIRVALGIIALFFVLKGIFYYFKGVYQVKLQQFFIRKMRLECIDGLGAMSYFYFAGADTGKIQNALTGEADKASKACQSYFQAFQHVLLVLIYIGFAFAVDWKFALMISVGGFLSDQIYRRIYRNTKGVSNLLSADNSHFQGMIQEFLGTFKYLKAIGWTDHYQKKLIVQVDSIEKNNNKIGVLSVVLNACREPLSILVVVLVILMQVSIFHTHLAALLISLMFFYRALGTMMQFQSSWNAFLALSGSLNHLKAFVHELKVCHDQNGNRCINGIQGGIRCTDIDFSYGERKILQGVSLYISKNETIAMVGESGSGKSTLVNLICGLLQPGSGKIEIDGINLIEADLKTLGKNIGYITQEPIIFNDTIYNNVTLWDEKSPENLLRFQEACTKAALWETVISLPQTQDAILGMSGVNLSGGQRQRVSIARELYKNVDLLILDEATSALDSITEQSIQESLQLLKGKLTLIIIAHRLATIKQADRIVFLEKGQVQQVDSFSELVRSNNVFKEIAELQQVI